MNLLIIIIYLTYFVVSVRNVLFAIMIFIAHLPIVPLIHANGTIPLNDFFSIIVFYHLFFSKKIVVRASLDKNVAKGLSVFLVVTAIVSYINDIKFIIMHDGILTSVPSHILDAVITSITVVNILHLLSKSMWNVEIRRNIYRGFLISSFILSISLFYSEELYLLGFKISEEVAFSERPSGLFADGDCNGLAGFLCLSIAIILWYNKLVKNSISKTVMFIVMLNSSAVLYTQSRMGFLCLISLIVYYVFILQDIRKSIPSLFYMVIGCIILLVFTDVFTGVLERLQGANVRNEVNGEEGRSLIWGMYLDYMFNSSQWNILWGADKMIFDIVPHNYYIYSFFVSGILFAILLILCQIYASMKCSLVMGHKIILPLNLLTIIPLLFLTDSTIIFYYVLSVGLIASIVYSGKNAY